MLGRRRGHERQRELLLGPSNARHDRGYTLEEALVAVGPGGRLWSKRRGAPSQRREAGSFWIKEKFGRSRVYFLAPPEHAERLEQTIDAL
jgi:hypothetical protein